MTSVAYEKYVKQFQRSHRGRYLHWRHGFKEYHGKEPQISQEDWEKVRYQEPSVCHYCQEHILQDYKHCVVEDPNSNLFVLSCTRCNVRKKDYKSTRRNALIRHRLSRREKRRSGQERYKTICRSIKERGLEVGLSEEEFVKWFQETPHVCHYCGEEVILGAKAREPFALTVDRKDNSRGYLSDNIVICCMRCNLVKNSWVSYEKMLRIGKILSEK